MTSNQKTITAALVLLWLLWKSRASAEPTFTTSVYFARGENGEIIPLVAPPEPVMMPIPTELEWPPS